MNKIQKFLEFFHNHKILLGTDHYLSPGGRGGEGEGFGAKQGEI